VPKGIVEVEVEPASGNFGTILPNDPKKHVHVGVAFIRLTVCGKQIGDILCDTMVAVTCPVCAAEINYRSEHPEARNQPVGVLTHLTVPPA